MIGQYYNKITLETIKSMRDDFVIVHGPFKSGKTTLIKEAYNDYTIIECDASSDGFDRLAYSLLSNKQERKLYLIQNCDYLAPGVFNKILKFAEEITELRSTLVMEYRGSYPDTLRTRAKVIEMQSYKKDDMSNMTNNNHILEIAPSPGIVDYLLNIDKFEESYNLGVSIVKGLYVADKGNLLKLPYVIDSNGLDYITILLVMMSMYVTNDKYTDQYLTVSKLYYSYSLSRKMNINMAFTNMLLELRKIV